MRSPARTFLGILGLAGVVVGCAQPSAPGNVNWQGHQYRTADEFREAVKDLHDKQLEAIAPMSDRIGGRVLVILPDPDRLRPVVMTWAHNVSPPVMDLFIEYDQKDDRTVAEGVKRSNLFDSVEVVERNDTENPPDTGYDYVLWHKVGTTGPNHTGRWYAQWALRRGAGSAEESMGADPGVPDRERVVAFLRSIRSAAAKLGGPVLADGTAPGAVPSGSLSGIAVSSSGDIVTNDHGVNGCSSMRVYTQALTLPASIVARDRQNDLALLHVNHGFAAPITFRDGSGIRQAETVVAIGFPYGAQFASNATVTSGSISALTGINDDSRFLQFTAPVQPGNSGGPLIDASGHVIGLVSAKLNELTGDGGSREVPQNVNFAIKSTVVREFLDANGVKYRAAPSVADLKSADIAEQVKQAVVYLECLK